LLRSTVAKIAETYFTLHTQEVLTVLIVAEMMQLLDGEKKGA
jgi:hypothetical protein